MMRNLYGSLFLVLVISNISMAQGTELIYVSEVVLSAVTGDDSRAGTLLFTNTCQKDASLEVMIGGAQADYFHLVSHLPTVLEQGASATLKVLFQPRDGYIGVAHAYLSLVLNSSEIAVVPMRGLSIKGLEGKNEPPLLEVMTALGYKINLGWSTLAHHTKSDLQGDEISQQVFRKSKSGPVEIIPLARYSPPWSLPFGYYHANDLVPTLIQIGVLADTTNYNYPEQQTLFPSIEHGTTSFDPGDAVFGIYTTSPTHNAFSEDKWNTLFYKDHAAHACRIYEARNAQGEIITDQYLVCFEEASNGDYQDYVFLLKNVRVER